MQQCLEKTRIVRVRTSHDPLNHNQNETLIMASRDHKAHARHLVRNEPKSKSTLTIDAPVNAVTEEQERRRACDSQRAGAALAIAVMEGMLKNHRALKQAHTHGKSTGHLPLNPVQCIGLETAIDLLHHYVDTLTPGRGG
jgi:hypothetical protein